ncbi:hypothetical protein RUM43_001166 [Polyplax serrata]|uniref:Uncharacterized protein n=1 Tax=Polyplax serrata TaxID=468196 RepID=A0AAN8XQ78_POLSC
MAAFDGGRNDGDDDDDDNHYEFHCHLKSLESPSPPPPPPPAPHLLASVRIFHFPKTFIRTYDIYAITPASGRAFTEVPGAREVAKRSGRKPERRENSDHHNNFKVDVLTARTSRPYTTKIKSSHH